MGVFQFLKTMVSTYKEDQRYQKKLSQRRSKHAEHLFQQGYAVIPDYVTSAQCDLWEDALRNYLESAGIFAMCEKPLSETFIQKYPSGAELNVRQSFDGHRNYDSGMIDFLDVHNEVPVIKEFRNDSFIQDLVNEAHGSQASVMQTSLYRTLSLNNPRSYHMDVYQLTIYKAFIYLTDVPSRDYGPYSYIKASHRPNVSRYLNLTLNKLRGYPSSDARIYQRGQEHLFTATRGTLIITNQRGYHRGHPQTESHERLLLVNVYKPL